MARRELVWFPEEAGADCYRVNRPDPMLLTRAFPGLQTATTRAAASRRDRFTSWLPMLRQPHREGTVGALRVEVRGRRRGGGDDGGGVGGRPALLAGAVAAGAASRAASGQLRPGAVGWRRWSPPRASSWPSSRTGVSPLYVPRGRDHPGEEANFP